MENTKQPIVLDFGKHKGLTLEEVPSDYLKWIIRTEFTQDLKDEARKELDQRIHRGVGTLDFGED